jgi:hypothetical protein
MSNWVNEIVQQYGVGATVGGGLLLLLAAAVVLGWWQDRIRRR